MKRILVGLCVIVTCAVAHPSAQVLPKPQAVSPLEFGAVCDGVHDDGDAFRRALASLDASGGEIVVPSRTCVLGSRLSLNTPGLWLHGAGPASRLRFSVSGVPLISVAAGSIRVSDLALDGTDTDGEIGISIEPQTNLGVILERLKTRSLRTHIRVSDIRGASFDHIIRDCDIELSGQNGETGIYLSHGANSITLDSNWIRGANRADDTTVGVRISGATGTRIVNSNIELNPRGNVVIDDADGTVTATYIGHNYFEPLSPMGLDVLIGHGAIGTVLDANFHNAGTTPSQFSIELSPGSTATAILNSRFENAALAAIHNRANEESHTVLLGNNFLGRDIDRTTGVAVLIRSDGRDSLIRGHLAVGTDAATRGPIDTGTGAFLSTAGIWANASSRSVMSGVTPLDQQAARRALMNLAPVFFRSRQAPNESHLGFVAEDVPALLKMPSQDGLSPMDFVAVLTSVVQQQEREIRELQKRLSR